MQLKAIVGICETPPLGENLWHNEGNTLRVKVDEVKELRTPLGAIYLKGKGLSNPILIVRDKDGEYRCFNNKCTHMGRKLDPMPEKTVLRCCSVNHSTFDLNGQKLSGPAKGPVKMYEAQMSNGELVINII